MNFSILSMPKMSGRYTRLQRVALLTAMVLSPLVLLSTPFAQETGAATSIESSNYLKGVEAYRAGEFRQAFDAWSLGAYEEDVESQYNLGVLYLEGRGVARNAEQARSWFLRAAQKNHPEAQYNLGHMALSGMGAEKDMDAALKWWQQSAEAGYPQAQFNYGRALYLGIRGEPDPAAGLVLIRSAAENGDTRAQKFLDENKLEVAAVDARQPASNPILNPALPHAVSGMNQSAILAGANRVEKPRLEGSGGASNVSGRNLPVSAAVVGAIDTESGPRVIALEPLPVSQASATSVVDVSPRSSAEPPVVSLLEDEAPQVIALAPLTPEREADRAATAQANGAPVHVIRARDTGLGSDRPMPAPVNEELQSSETPALIIVRDEVPLLHEYFLRSVDEDVSLYANIDSGTPTDTIAPKTLLRVRAVEGDKLLVDALSRSEVWVLALGIESADGLAVSRGKSVPMFNAPGGRQIGVLPQHQSMLVLEQRKGWQKLSLLRRLNGWIDARSLAYSGETASQLKARWEAGLKGLALSKQQAN